MHPIPAPHGWGTNHVESFVDYRQRWPKRYEHIPDCVIETWIHRHWGQFKEWLPLCPLDWTYELHEMSSREILTIGHVANWMSILTGWGNDLLDRDSRKATWLGRFMLEQGTTPAPIIVAQNAGHWPHPRVPDEKMHEPLQLIEGHMRLAYLRALIQRRHSTVKATHSVIIATLPPSPSKRDA